MEAIAVVILPVTIIDTILCELPSDRIASNHGAAPASLNFFDDEANIDNIPTFIDTELIQYIVQMVSALSRRVNTLETEVIILKRQIAEGGGGGGTEGELNPRYTYLVTEDGFYLATEEGECFVLEQENSVAGGTESELDPKYTYLVTEDNVHLATEQGECFVLEQENK